MRRLTDIIMMSYTASHGYRTTRSGDPVRPRGGRGARRRGSAAAGERLAAAVESSLQLRLFDVLTEATLALNAQLSSGHVEVRLAGRDPELVLVDDRAGEAEPRRPRATISVPASRFGYPRR